MESLDDNDGDLTRVNCQRYRGLGHVDGAIQQTLPALPLGSRNLWFVGCPGCDYCRFKSVSGRSRKPVADPSASGKGERSGLEL
jgi:hypothetical protein